MTPSGIESATFRFAAQHLNHCATAVPRDQVYRVDITRGSRSSYKLIYLYIKVLEGNHSPFFAGTTVSAGIRLAIPSSASHSLCNIPKECLNSEMFRPLPNPYRSSSLSSDAKLITVPQLKKIILPDDSLLLRNSRILHCSLHELADGISFTATGQTTKTKTLRFSKGSSQKSVESDQPITIIINHVRIKLLFLWRCGPTRAMASSFLRFLDHTQRRITVGRTPLDERSARHRNLYLTTHNTHNKHTCLRWDSNPRSRQESGRIPTP